MKPHSEVKYPKLLGHVSCICAAFIIGTGFWFIQYWIPWLFPFAVAYTIVRPVYKIWKELGDF